MRQRTNLFGRVWSMRPSFAWANKGGQKEDRNDYIIGLINLIILFSNLMTGYDLNLAVYRFFLIVLG